MVVSNQSIPIFHVFLSTIYLLFSPNHVPQTVFSQYLQGYSLYQFSFNILNTWKNLLFNQTKIRLIC